MEQKTSNRYSKFSFQDTTGPILDHPEQLIVISHTASVSPWKDTNLHQHDLSEEYYFLRQGQLEFLIRDFQLTLHPNEILMVRPGVAHAVVGGAGRIEHFEIRTPALDDRQIIGELVKDAPYLYENEPLVSADWGHRIPLDMPAHQNCWLIGAGSALYKSGHLIMAYLDFPTEAEANAGMGTRHQLHLHRKSWEYYVVLDGGKDILLIEDTHVAIHPGEILEVPPNVNHTLYSRRAPFQGFTIRVPVEMNDKVTAGK